MAGSGGKRVVISTRERATSTDVNRLQKFLGAQTSEVFRSVFDQRTNVESEANSLDHLGESVTAPLRTTVFSGLAFLPEVGGITSTITAGVLGVVAPESPLNADDSAYKVCRDPGTTLITMAAGHATLTRIDVIECAYDEMTLETNTRDQFNPATGLFASTTFDKVRGGRLTYRLRQGTAGGGIPAMQSGWLPLAILSVPATATDWDAVTIWDVRPLASDRAEAPYERVRAYAEQDRSFIFSVNSAGPTLIVKGLSETRFNGYNSGGQIFSQLDVTNVANQEGAGATLAAQDIWYAWSCFPAGLPRWVRYTPASSGSRVPSGLRGILVVSDKGPGDMRGRPVSPITMPDPYGLATSTSDAVIFTTGKNDFAAPGTPLGSFVTGGITHLNPDIASTHSIAPAVAATTEKSVYDLIDNTHVPASARAVHVVLNLALVNPSINPLIFTVASYIEVSDPDAPASVVSQIVLPTQFVQLPGGATLALRYPARIPVISTTSSLGLKTRRFTWFYNLDAAPPDGFNPGAGAVSAASVKIFGWELGP